QPCLMTFFPRPVGFPGRTITSIDLTKPGLSRCSLWSARSATQLNSSDPQKRILRGSEACVELNLFRAGLSRHEDVNRLEQSNKAAKRPMVCLTSDSQSHGYKGFASALLK